GADPSLRFMLDVEMRYSPRDAYRAARVLEELDFEGFEAPLLDTDLQGYRELRRRVNIPIIPAGNWLLAPGLIEAAIRMGCWGSVRVDTTSVGRVHPAGAITAVGA